MLKLHLTGIETCRENPWRLVQGKLKLHLTGIETSTGKKSSKTRVSSNCTLLELKLVCEPHSLVRISEDEMNLYR